MDGTLTRAVHDFAAIRAELGLPADEPILEALAAMPDRQAAPLWRRLDEMEFELARQATPMHGVADFLRVVGQSRTGRARKDQAAGLSRSAEIAARAVSELESPRVRTGYR